MFTEVYGRVDDSSGEGNVCVEVMEVMIGDDELIAEGGSRRGGGGNGGC